MHAKNSLYFFACLIVVSLLLTAAGPSTRPSSSVRLVDQTPAQPVDPPGKTLEQALAYAAEHPETVRTAGTNCGYQTIQGALDNADSGDTIQIEGKTWTGTDATINVPDKDLTLIGGYNSYCSGDPIPGQLTILDAQQFDAVLEVLGSSSTYRYRSLYNFGLTGGLSGMGGGLQTGSNTSWTIWDSYIYANSAIYGGGIAVGSDSGLMLYDTMVYSNTATSDGGGIYCKSTTSYHSSVTLHSDSSIGEEYATGWPPHFVKSGNRADNSGGGLFLDNCQLTLNTGSVLYNQAEYGGGVYTEGNSTIYLYNTSKINENQAWDGGGLELLSGGITMYKGQVNDNQALNDGGGLFVSGAGVYAYNQDPCNTVGCTQISGNSAVRNGGGLNLSENAIGFIAETYMVGNQADGSASAAYVSGLSNLSLRSVMLTGGDAPDSVIRLDNNGGAPTLSVQSSTIAGNTGNSVGIFRLDPGATLDGDNLIIWGNTSSSLVAGGGSATIDCSILHRSYPGTNNLIQNPLFVNAAGGDYHIQWNSPAVDHCTSGPPRDVDYQKRPSSMNIALPGLYDAGADEYLFSLIYLPLVRK
jgi:hypothetical protein